MGRVYSMEHRGVAVAVLDFSGLTEVPDALAAIREAGEFVRRHPPKSLLVLTDVTDARFNTQILDAIKELVAGNGPHIKASAIVGLAGLHRVAYTLITRLSGRNIPSFPTRAAALDWLLEQG